MPASTPPELSDRRLTTVDVLPSPPDDRFRSSVGPVPADVLARSTWTEECPVSPEDLAYVTVTFRGFDGLAHTGELIVAESVATDLVSVFEAIYVADFPLEEMRVTSSADLEAAPTGDGNATSGFACRPVTGGQRWSEHALGLAIDVNPFHNPYVRGDLVLPELAGDYLDRTRRLPGMITEGDAVTRAFDAIGWKWGGRWSSLKDYQHFSLRGR
ncbi:MAG TPA: M15 family metallopeptidase [Acidimicrobiia bacterium]|nr:M15 family metallopeptidase [Acidimicrobiia bacterium]